jgi:hypothetical protein
MHFYCSCLDCDLSMSIRDNTSSVFNEIWNTLQDMTPDFPPGHGKGGVYKWFSFEQRQFCCNCKKKDTVLLFFPWQVTYALWLSHSSWAAKVYMLSIRIMFCLDIVVFLTVDSLGLNWMTMVLYMHFLNDGLNWMYGLLPSYFLKLESML